MDVEHLTTARLRLDRLDADDLDEHHALHSDPRVWRHYPAGRHDSLERTRRSFDRMTHGWRQDGLGYWTVRLREPLGHLAAGAYVGIGGCGVRPDTDWWNLYYRFRPESHGHGLAVEVARAAIDAAHRVAPAHPVIAYLMEANLGSRRTAERAGLRLIWRGPEPTNPVPDTVRLVFADRPLTAATLVAALENY